MNTLQKNESKTGLNQLYLIMRITIFQGEMMRTKMISRFYKSRILSVASMLFLILLPRIAFGQPGGLQRISQPVNITVSDVSIIRVIGGHVDLNIDDAVVIAGVDQMISIPNEASKLIWGTNSTPRKITIRTNLITQLYTLKAEAISPSQGTAAGEVILSTAEFDYDFITDIGKSVGSARIRYTAIALASKGMGTDSHTITYTITQ